LPALELALESKFRESGDSPIRFELSWRPGGSVGFLIDLFRIFELTMVVVREREVVNSSALGAVVLLAGALEDDTWWSSLQKCAAETACMFLGGIALASVTTTRVEEEEEVSRQRWSRDSK